MDILRKFVVLKPFSAHPSSTLGPQQTHLESFAMCTHGVARLPESNKSL
jgi:hypothetical protein